MERDDERMKTCKDCIHFPVCGEINKDPSHCHYFCKTDEQNFVISDKLWFCPGNCINDYETGYMDAIKRTESPVIYAHWISDVKTDSTDQDMTFNVMWYCSNCGKPYFNRERYKNKRYNFGFNFCPSCGATMLHFEAASDDKKEESYGN